MRRTLQLAVIGTAAGVFSGLFGVGGGTVMVPLLVLWLGYEEREATGTSLAAIVIIATVAVAVQAAYGNVHVDEGLLVGHPGGRRRAGRDGAPAARAAADDLARVRRPARGDRDHPARLMDVVAALGIGFAAGVVAGMLGVGGGILFVPALTLALGPQPGRGGGDVAAGDRAGRRWSAPGASTATATCACATACTLGLLGGRRRRGRAS